MPGPAKPLVVQAYSTASVDRLWEVVTDWNRHGSYFPLTTMSIEPGAPGVGQEFAGTTALGPVRFVDSMVVTQWQPPGHEGCFAIHKTGRLLAGTATVRVQPEGAGSRITWTTDAGPRPQWLGRLVAPVSRLAGRVIYGRVVTGMAKVAAHGD